MTPTFADIGAALCSEAETFLKRNHQRKGQALYSALCTRSPYLAATICGTKADPYSDDRRQAAGGFLAGPPRTAHRSLLLRAARPRRSAETVRGFPRRLQGGAVTGLAKGDELRWLLNGDRAAAQARSVAGRNGTSVWLAGTHFFWGRDERHAQARADRHHGTRKLSDSFLAGFKPAAEPETPAQPERTDQ